MLELEIYIKKRKTSKRLIVSFTSHEYVHYIRRLQIVKDIISGDYAISRNKRVLQKANYAARSSYTSFLEAFDVLWWGYVHIQTPTQTHKMLILRLTDKHWGYFWREQRDLNFVCLYRSLLFLFFRYFFYHRVTYPRYRSIFRNFDILFSRSPSPPCSFLLSGCFISGG